MSRNVKRYRTMMGIKTSIDSIRERLLKYIRFKGNLATILVAQNYDLAIQRTYSALKPVVVMAALIIINLRHTMALA